MNLVHSCLRRELETRLERRGMRSDMCDKLSQCEQCDEVACLLFASTSPTKPANKLEFLCCKLRAISDAAGNASFEMN